MDDGNFGAILAGIIGRHRHDIWLVYRGQAAQLDNNVIILDGFFD